MSTNMYLLYSEEGEYEDVSQHYLAVSTSIEILQLVARQELEKMLHVYDDNMPRTRAGIEKALAAFEWHTKDDTFCQYYSNEHVSCSIPLMESARGKYGKRNIGDIYSLLAAHSGIEWHIIRVPLASIEVKGYGHGQPAIAYRLASSVH